MARPDDEFVLSPYQRTLVESQQPARESGAQWAATAPWAPENNPLVAGPDTGIAPTGTETAAVSGAPNPFTRPQPLAQLPTPPVPVGSMSFEQKVAWQTLADQQTERERLALEDEAKQRTRELRDEQIAQGRKIMAELPKLREAVTKGDLDTYSNLQADLFSRNPAGAASDEVKAAMRPLENIYSKAMTFEENRNRAELQRKHTTLQTRIEAGHKQAAELGPEVQRQYAAAVEKDPEGAMQHLADIVGAARREDIEAQLGKERAAQFQRPEGFLYRAAEAEIKRQMTPAQQVRELGSYMSQQLKARSAANYMGETDNPVWTPDQEAAYQDTVAQYNALQNRGAGNRAGVQGMETLPMLPQGETYTRAQRTPQVTPQQTTTSPAPAKSWLPSIGQVARVVAPLVTPLAAGQAIQQLRGNVAGQFVGGARESAGTTPVEPAAVMQPPTEPAATPAPEPVGTRKVIAGIESVKYPDGKWYKVKQTTQ